MVNSKTKKNENNNASFIFGLSLGAAVGALAAILINHHQDEEVVHDFESKVKDFFQDLINNIRSKKSKKVISPEIEFVDAEPEEETQSSSKKTHPKMFVKK